MGQGKFHLVKWDVIAKPRDLDGWGALDTKICHPSYQKHITLTMGVIT